jgi:repressor LexA
MKKISKKQAEVFNFIKGYIDENGVSPSVREIAKAVDLTSPSTVQHHIVSLIDKGYLEKGDANQKRTLKIAKRSNTAQYVPLIGTVTAGNPILAIESIEDYIPAPVSSNGAEHFALRVRGDSMINAAIEDGDIVIVERTPVAENGDIVVALIEDEATVKRFYKENGHFRLQPENDSYEPIIVDELAILGKITALIRNYN